MNFLVVSKLESSFAIASIFEDSDSEGAAASEVIDLVKVPIYAFKNFLSLVSNYVILSII